MLVLKSKEQLDAGIIEMAKTDSEAFGQVYDFYFPRVYAFVMAKIGDQMIAEDLVSDVFVKLLDNLPKYQDRGLPFSAWLFTVARNVIFDYFAKNNRSKTTVLEEGMEIKDEREDSSPKAQAIDGELKDKVKAVMARLPERELSVLQMKFFAGLNNREIAAALNLTESNVGIILYRVLRKIKPDLNNF